MRPAFCYIMPTSVLIERLTRGSSPRLQSIVRRASAKPGIKTGNSTHVVTHPKRVLGALVFLI